MARATPILPREAAGRRTTLSVTGVGAPPTRPAERVGPERAAFTDGLRTVVAGAVDGPAERTRGVMPSYDDPDEVRRAKARVSAPLGREIVRFPLQFAQPVLIGPGPRAGQAPTLSNGTATLLRLDGREFAVTCEHVLAKYRELRAGGDRTVVFQVGMLAFDPEDRLTAEDKRLDLAVFDLTNLGHARASVRGSGAFQFHEPRAWPPALPTPEEEFVSLAGFPGAGRQPPVGDHIDFDTFALGAHPVTSAHRERLTFQFEREYWEPSYGQPDPDFAALGGMSGGPVMVMRRLHWDMAGFITHFSESWDLLFAAPAVRLQSDGTLDPE